MIQFDLDKRLHFAVGVVVATLTSFFVPSLAFPVLLVVAVGKEVYDYFHPANHTSDVTDALATIAGGTMALYALSWFR